MGVESTEVILWVYAAGWLPAVRKGQEKVSTWSEEETIPILKASTLPVKCHNTKEGRRSEWDVLGEKRNMK